MPTARGLTISEAIGQTLGNSLGLLAIAFALSLALGLAFGLRSVRASPPAVSGWLTPITTVGLAMPSFYIGALLIAGSIYYLFWRGPGTALPLPLNGFGWDAHLVFPVLALMARPTLQIAQSTASLLVGELHKQYVVAARSVGYTWRRIRRREALRNVLAPIILSIAGSFRSLVVELLLVETLFNWPGIGRMLANTLIPPETFTSTSSGIGVMFLNPSILATAVTGFAAVFLLTDFVAASLARAFDPRMRAAEASHD
jgi:ABC-type dipeptide/oligopeptide/nickel transport system permease component